jgi:hypothetical protein
MLQQCEVGQVLLVVLRLSRSCMRQQMQRRRRVQVR